MGQNPGKSQPEGEISRFCDIPGLGMGPKKRRGWVPRERMAGEGPEKGWGRGLSKATRALVWNSMYVGSPVTPPFGVPPAGWGHARSIPDVPRPAPACCRACLRKCHARARAF
jgi:hypothetical protein